MINFKPHSRKDIVYRIRWLNDPEANAYIGDQTDTDQREQTEWFDRYEKDKNKIFFTIYDDARPIGFMGLSNINQPKEEASLFIMIGEKEYRGKGVGRFCVQYLIDYASRKLQLARLTLEVLKGNLPALRLYQKIGFIQKKKSGEEIFMALELK
jgi:RimJ/RimL family protein N-acetyltransferase